jgi:Outer membrane protein beta-barrel domain
MKKLFLFFFLAFFVLPRIGAAQQMMIGVRGGVNLADLAYPVYPAGDNPGSQGSTIKPGVLAGGQFDYLFNRTWTVSIQLLFDQKGGHSDSYAGFVFPNYSGAATADWTTDYLEVPILAKVSTGIGPASIYLFLGSSIGFLLSNIEKVSNGYGLPGNEPYYSRDTTVNITDSTAKIDFSCVSGLGASFKLASGPELFIDATFTLGLTNIDNYYWDKVNGISIYSRDIRIAAGVLFPLH